MDQPPLVTRRGFRWIARRLEQGDLRPRHAAIAIAIFWLVAIVAFGVVEHLIDRETFDNVWLGMWWATQTVTTVGFGDVVPNQTAGQIMASVLMIGGLSFFAVITAVITSAFVSRSRATQGHSVAGIERRLDRISSDLAELRSELDRRDGR